MIWLIQVALTWQLGGIYARRLGSTPVIWRMRLTHTVVVGLILAIALLAWGTGLGNPEDAALDAIKDRWIGLIFTGGLLGLNLLYLLQAAMVKVWGEPLKPAVLCHSFAASSQQSARVPMSCCPPCSSF
ncbi:MAG: hypothetical protein J6386_03150 [Candidatus Synoicihabitans palmerolidicus]|nr:hypothetical protein [Candidatus Synoicihabitans palmerolidicus]